MLGARRIAASLGCAPLLVTIALGCRASTPPAPAEDGSRDGARQAATSLARLGLPATDGLDLDAKYDALFDTPALSAAGERFLDRVGAAPELGTQLEAFLAALVTDPGFVATAGQLLVEDPSGGMQALAGRLDAAMNDPRVEAALDRSLDALFDSKAVDDAAERLVVDILEASDLVARMTQLLLSWQPDLEAAVGVPMGHDDFTAKFEAHLAQHDRSARVERLVLDHLIAKGSLTRAVVALLESDAFVQVAVQRLSRLLGDDAFIDAAAAVIVALIDRDPSAASKVEALVLGPSLSQTAVGWIDDVGELPQTAAIGESLGAVLDDPELVAQLHAIVVGVPKLRTAQAQPGSRLGTGPGSSG